MRKVPRLKAHVAAAAIVVVMVGVRLAQPDAKGEVEKNWAVQGNPTQSSTALGADAHRAIDGNTNGDWNGGSVTHTNQEVEPFWQIDLGESHYIDEIRIYNRTDCCTDRLHDLMVFYTNNKVGFVHRDIASIMGENTGPEPSTAAYGKPVFGLAGDLDPGSGTRLARTTLRFSGDECSEPGLPGCKMRFIRIQLAGTGILSLAEVEIIEKATIPGPAQVGHATTWVPTGVAAAGAGVALAAQGERLLLYYRGSDGLLHGSDDLAAGPAIPGSPAVGTEAPAAAVAEALGRGFVAVRTASGEIAVAEGDVQSGALASPAWNTLGSTSGSPFLATGCGRVVAAWIDQSRILAAWKPADPASPSPSWSSPATVSPGAATRPTLAVNSRGDVGIGFLAPNGAIQFSMLSCGKSAPAWTAVTTLVGFAKGDQVSMAAYGPHFMAATQGGDDRGYFAIQHLAGNAEEWQGFEPIPASKRGDPGLPLMEPPRLFVMSGAIVAAAREKSSQEMLYWLKYPNHLAGGDRWMGGRPVGGSGKAAMGPAMVSLGQAQLWGMWQAPSELYVATMGLRDRRVYALNLGRFMASDVFLHDLSLDVVGMLDIAPQSDRGLDPTLGSNYLEQLLTVLALPIPAQDAVVGTQCGRFTLATRLELDRNFGSGQFNPGMCPYKVIEGTNRFSASGLMHEWIHMDATARKLTTQAGFTDAFPFDGSSMDPAKSGMKVCRQDPDCGGDTCETAGNNHNNTLSSTQDYDPAENSIRRWDNTMVCVSAGAIDSRRPQGGLIWYDIGTADHAFIHMAMAYRWYGDDLRDWVNQDLGHGNDQLQRRYAWIKAHYFGDVEYNGRMNSGGSLPWSNRSLGAYGMPSR
ncbi:MAG: discoidin domain-containing protein [Gemmatimonadota bacterium]